MMEFIIVLPLHLLMLFGTVYLGTIAMDRNAVVSMDHFAAFVKQNSLEGIKDFYAAGDGYFKVKQEFSAETSASENFLSLSKSRLMGARGVPSWLEGLRTLSRLFLQLDDSENKILADVKMRRSNDETATSVALIRNANYTIDRSATQNWAAVANEPFFFGDAPVAVVQNNLDEYSRNSLCTKWSTVKL